MAKSNADADQTAPIIADQQRPGGFIVRVGGASQSYVDLHHPELLEFEYVQLMGDVINRWFPAPERISALHIGGAGMTLPRFIAATRPTSAQVVLEPDESLTQLVREQLPLPKNSGIKVRAQTGQDGVKLVKDDWADLIIADAFEAGQVPAELTTTEFFAELHRVLRPSGLLLVNLTDRIPFDYARRVVAGLNETFAATSLAAEPSVLKGRRFGNLVLVGSDTAIPVEDLARTGARLTFPYRVLDREQLQQFIGGAQPFTVADSARSPDLLSELKLL